MAKKPTKHEDRPHWPTIEEQLEHSKVIPDSALEKLILENQEFHMLRPEEAHDRLRLPLWLRVHWRKKHPEARYSGDDPTGGYPRALRDLYGWMLRHQDLKREEPESHEGGRHVH